VIGTASAATTTGLLAALLRGDAIPWSAFEIEPEDFVRVCSARNLTGLVCESLRRSDVARHWPAPIWEALERETRWLAANELLREKELVSVFDALATEGIVPIVLKGSALAYSLYNHPSSRPRVDTDLLISRHDVDTVRRVMARRGYTAPPYCDGDLLFCQFPLDRRDEFGVVHAFDFHWKISTQSVFADLLVFEEIAAGAVAVPALGVHARTAGPLHALLLACIHPVMHHRNAESLIWIHDIHLLASRLSAQELDRFAELAAVKRVSAICAHQLSAARKWLGTRIPDSVMTTLAAVHDQEPSAAYLRPNRRWSNELISSMGALSRWSDRWRLLREVVLPDPTYILQAYSLEPSRFSAVVLPVLYLHRFAAGGWRVLTGQK
jgi:putative nucleotidyltransferase-like protein